MAKEQPLVHTKWLCRYHIVFPPKYRRKVIYGQYREEIGKIIRQLCNYKGIEIIEGNMMIDHLKSPSSCFLSPSGAQGKKALQGCTL